MAQVSEVLWERYRDVVAGFRKYLADLCTACYVRFQRCLSSWFGHQCAAHPSCQRWSVLWFRIDFDWNDLADDRVAVCVCIRLVFERARRDRRTGRFN